VPAEVPGEVTIVVSGEGGAPVVAEPTEALEVELVRRLAAGEAATAIAKDVARARGLKRSDVYAAIERLKRQ
jgi:16S rRNA (cytidine1402-2'-O)-methyltransferase